MQERKKKEIEYYDKEADSASNSKKELGSKQNFNPFLLNSYNFLRLILKKKSFNKKILDYGCGSGVHLHWLSKIGKEVIGIDLSKKSLELAERKIKKDNLENKIKILLMDCEETEFSDNFFDIIFDGGTFSSLDLDKILPELKRILKPEGMVIGIETLGHNPFTNLKRLINKRRGDRTAWATEHIFKMKDFKKVKKYFNKIEAYYFHLTSWICFPLLNSPGGVLMLKIFETIDKFLLFIFPFLKRYCFKIVFIFSEPINLNI